MSRSSDFKTNCIRLKRCASFCTRLLAVSHGDTPYPKAAERAGWRADKPEGGPRHGSYCAVPAHLRDGGVMRSPFRGTLRPPEIRRECFGIQMLTGGVAGQFVPRQGLAGGEHTLLHVRAHLPLPHVVRLRRVHPTQDLPGDRAVDLGREELPHHVVVVVAWGADDVDLAGVVRGMAARGTSHPLVLRDQVPPELVEVLVRVLVHPLPEPQHHLAPAGEDGVWQRFATKWAIVFTIPSQSRCRPVRLLWRNANSTPQRRGGPRPQYPSQDQHRQRVLPSRGLMLRSRGKRTGFGIADRLRTPNVSTMSGRIWCQIPPVTWRWHRSRLSQVLLMSSLRGRMAHFVANRCHIRSWSA